MERKVIQNTKFTITFSEVLISKVSKINKPRRWPEMSKRLSKGTTEEPALVSEECIHKNLYSMLSTIGKANEGKIFVYHLDDLWTMLIDHVFTVLGLIDFDKVNSEKS